MDRIKKIIFILNYQLDTSPAGIVDVSVGKGWNPSY